MPGENAEIFRDADDAIAQPHEIDLAREGGATDHGSSEVVVLDDTDPSLTALDSHLIERNRQLQETLRSLQDALAEWTLISAAVADPDKKPGQPSGPEGR